MSSYPDDRPVGSVEPTQPLRVDDPAPEPSGSYASDRQPAGGGHYVDVRDDARGTNGRDGSSAMDEAVQNLSQPDQRAKLLMAIAGMVLLTLILTLVLLLMRLSEGGPEPVLVEGVPCLVEEGEEDQAVLYCQR